MEAAVDGFQHISFAYCVLFPGWAEDSFQSNASSFVYRVLPLSPSAKTVVFQVSATADLHVILSPSQLMDDASYHLVLGGADNSYSWVSTGSNGRPTQLTAPKEGADVRKIDEFFFLLASHMMS